jgi:hypothetical protein
MTTVHGYSCQLTFSQTSFMMAQKLVADFDGYVFCHLVQVLANRPDIIREDYMNELCVLQDDVPAFANEVCTFLNLFLLRYYYFLLVCLSNVVLSNFMYWDFHCSSI